MSAPRPVSRKQQRHDELANTSIRRALRPSTAPGAAVATAAGLAVLWAVVLVDAVLDHRLLHLGIKPRETGGLAGIVVSPLLHADARQLAANTIPIAVLAWLMLISGARYFVLVTLAAGLASGVVGWLAGPSHTVLLGAGGILFGWLGYVLARAWFGRKLKWIAIAAAVAAVFSSMFTGLLPRLHDNVFWGSQLAGFVAGALVASLLHRRNRQRKTRRPRRSRSAGEVGGGSVF